MEEVRRFSGVTNVYHSFNAVGFGVRCSPKGEHSWRRMLGTKPSHIIHLLNNLQCSPVLQNETPKSLGMTSQALCILAPDDHSSFMIHYVFLETPSFSCLASSKHLASVPLLMVFLPSGISSLTNFPSWVKSSTSVKSQLRFTTASLAPIDLVRSGDTFLWGPHHSAAKSMKDDYPVSGGGQHKTGTATLDVISGPGSFLLCLSQYVASTFTGASKAARALTVPPPAPHPF